MVAALGLAIQLGPVHALDVKQAASAKSQTSTNAVQTDTGAVRGLVIGDKRDIHVYKGIPFAAPPTGERRWKPPQAAERWQGVRDCFEFGPACPQKIPALFKSVPEMAIRAPFNEDCLYLNVWTPAERQSDKLPVLYWIHGGGFVMGAASQTLYDGEELARLGCVVVSANYRLALFGFLAHPALSAESTERASGNYGILDQIEGLRWVKRNIAAFGGDPDRVCILGESAGGMSVLCLMAAPEAKGLFHSAIAQSAATMNMLSLRSENPEADSAEKAGQKFMAACGLTTSADAGQMRQLDAKTLANSGPSEPPPGAPLNLKPLKLDLGPIVDGRVIPDQVNAIFAKGQEHAVPLIVGSTRDEMSLMLLGTRMPSDEAAYRKQLDEDFGDLAAGVAERYPLEDAKQIRSTVIQLASDLSFIAESRFIARTHSAAGQKTYRYQFSLGTNRGFLQSLGAHHGAELAYLFQHPAGGSEKETRISRTMGRYWINFAATGDPNGKDLPPWPIYRSDAEEMINFGDQATVLKGDRNNQLDAIEKVSGATAGKTAK
jgi:para-nitrobenzyl esterase